MFSIVLNTYLLITQLRDNHFSKLEFFGHNRTAIKGWSAVQAIRAAHPVIHGAATHRATKFTFTANLATRNSQQTESNQVLHGVQMMFVFFLLDLQKGYRVFIQ